MGKMSVPGDARAISRSRVQRAARFVPVATTVAPAGEKCAFNTKQIQQGHHGFPSAKASYLRLIDFCIAQPQA